MRSQPGMKSTAAQPLRPKAYGLEKTAQLRGRERLLESVGIGAERAENLHHERAEKGVELVRDPDDPEPSRLQDPVDLGDRSLVVLEMLDRPHRVDEVDRLAAQRQRPDVRDGESRPVAREDRAGQPNGLRSDVDPDGLCALLGGPSEDLRPFGFVPEIRLEKLAAGEVRKELRKE